MNHDDSIMGIDLGTTYSEVAVFTEGRVQVLGKGGTTMLASCVGISPAGELLIGDEARNQQLLYPERTARSIKRKMGSDELVTLGDKQFTPQEISALILRELANWVENKLGVPVRKAVITVPAYFSDAQRTATREAGQLAGLEVVRILNEPTAASLAYGCGSGEKQTVMVYDLGGGTFDVSIVVIENDITEVLASHGNNNLGGDDFDQLLIEWLARKFKEVHGVEIGADRPSARARLWRAAEEAKRKLSFEPFVMIREEALVTIDGKPLHLEVEVSRDQFEELIRPLMDSTLESVSKAMDDAGKRSSDLDAILLVGGSTRIPLVSKMLNERAGITPRQDVHPDLCVALGAGTLASRLAGHDVEKVLVDVSPFSFGPSHLGSRGGAQYPHCYRPIICRNTPLPVTRTESYFTAAPYQTEVEIFIYQGDDDDALKNIPVGQFRIEGLQAIYEPNLVLCRMSLDIDGILKVSAIEKDTGKTKHITIDNALVPKSDAEIASARERLQDLFASRSNVANESDDEFDDSLDENYSKAGAGSRGTVVADASETTAAATDPHCQEVILQMDPAWEKARQNGATLLERSRQLLNKMHDEDKEDAIGLHEQIESAMDGRDEVNLSRACEALKELLFFVEGR